MINPKARAGVDPLHSQIRWVLEILHPSTLILANYVLYDGILRSCRFLVRGGRDSRPVVVQVFEPRHMVFARF